MGMPVAESASSIRGASRPMRATAPVRAFQGFDQRREILPLAVSAENDEDAAALSCEALNGSGHSAHVGALRVVDEGNAVTIEHALDSMRLAPVRGKRGERRSDGQACSSMRASAASAFIALWAGQA